MQAAGRDPTRARSSGYWFRCGLLVLDRHRSPDSQARRAVRRRKSGPLGPDWPGKALGQGIRSLAVKTQSIRFRGGVARVAAWHGHPEIASVALQCRGAPEITAIERLC